MTISLFFLMLRARMRIVLTAFVLTVLTATVVSLLLPKYYKATSQVVLNYKAVDSVTGTPALAQQLPGYVQTQVDIIRSRSTALTVVDHLQLVDNADLKAAFMDATEGRGQIREWMANHLLQRLDVEPSHDSSVLGISFMSHDPALSAAVANEFARAYQTESTRLKVEPSQEAARYFGEQAKGMRDNLQQAQDKLSRYQQTHGITSADERLDVETAKLNELSQQLVIAQAQAIEAQSRQSSVQANAADSPDVAQNPVIQNLRVEASRASSKLAELSERLGPSHPQYQAAKAELDKIQAQLQQEIRRTSSSVGSTARIQQQREADLRTQVAMQKAKVLELNRLRDEMGVLQKDVETAQKSMDAANQRFTQTSLEGQARQSDIAILNLAQPPGAPTSPRVGLNILLSIVLGGLLGVGLGMIAELMDRRIRSSDEVARLLKVPVVALIEEKPRVTALRMLPGGDGPGKFLLS